MQTNEISLATRGIGAAETGRLRATAIARRVLQGVGGGACVLLAAAMPWSEFSPAGMTVGPMLLPMALLAGVGVMVIIGLGFFAASVWGLVKRLPPTTRIGLFIISGLTLFSAAGFEYGYLRSGGLVAYEYRPAVRLIGYALGIALLACSVPEELGPRLAMFIRGRQLRFRHVLALAGLTTATGSLIAVYVLDAMPHIIDGTSYLLQARMLWSGTLALDTPAYPELFAPELLQFRITEAGYFSKYPVGWPAVLGLFDSFGVAWLANAMLAGVLVLLTYAVIAEQGAKRLAGVAAVIVALSPWLWLNAGTMMSHLAAAAWLWLFLWLFLRMRRLRSRSFAALAGLALGAAILTRPADAAFFALPCIVVSLGWMYSRPDVWLTRLPLVAVGAMPGLIAYLVINHVLAGSGTAATYGDGHTAMLFSQSPDSMLHGFAWLHEGWVGMNVQWFAGALPVGMMVLCGLVFGRPFMRGQWLTLACAASLFVCYAVFVFGGRAWVGPRWYVPLIPAMALPIAAGLLAAANAGRVRSPGGVLAAGYLRAILVALVVILAVAVPARLLDLRQTPPHGIDGRLVEAVSNAGISQAVVALPQSGLDPETRKPNYKRGIAGMWAMQTPFEQNDVIYITAVDGWQKMAEDSWPDRTLYTMNDRAGNFELYRVTPHPRKPADGAD